MDICRFIRPKTTDCVWRYAGKDVGPSAGSPHVHPVSVMSHHRVERCLTEDSRAPGGVYLCQVSDRVSCAACCGVYNDRSLHPERLRRQLIERTRRFAGVRREVETIDAFARRTMAREKRKPKFADFHSCPFVGLVGNEGRRVGCLLHPSAAGNRGIDYRGLSYYGGLACRGYFCLSYRRLTAEIKTIVRTVARDWYAYGLIITETDWLKACFDALQQRVGAEITAPRVFRDTKNPPMLRDLLHLKLHWPYRRRPAAGACNYFFEDGRYCEAGVRYPAACGSRSRYHELFCALASEFESQRSLQQAEAFVEKRLEVLAAGLR